VCLWHHGGLNLQACDFELFMVSQASQYGGKAARHIVKQRHHEEQITGRAL
jgi:hypothetical protein